MTAKGKGKPPKAKLAVTSDALIAAGKDGRIRLIEKRAPRRKTGARAKLP
jgi:hypothetical protein